MKYLYFGTKLIYLDNCKLLQLTCFWAGIKLCYFHAHVHASYKRVNFKPNSTGPSQLMDTAFLSMPALCDTVPLGGGGC